MSQWSEALHWAPESHEQITTGKRPQTVWVVGSQCIRYTSNSGYGTVKDQVKLDIIGTAAEGNCFGTRSNAMSTDQDLLPEPHSRTSNKITQDCWQRRTFYILYRGSHNDLHTSYKNFLWTSTKNFHTSTSAEHLQDLNARTSWGWFQQDLQKILLTRTYTRPCKDLLKDFQDLYQRFSQGTVKGTKIFMPGPPTKSHKARHKRTCCWRGSHKILVHEPLKSIREELS